MAEALLRHELDKRGCADVEVESRGTWAGFGNPATQEAVDALGELEIDLRSHRSQPLTGVDVEEADVVVAMTSVHLRELGKLSPDAMPKVVLMKELAEIAAESSGSEDAAGRLTSFLAGQRPEPRRSLDVDDPIGLPLYAYQRCVRELQTGIEVLANVICGK
jgi:protein-tyrosine-phosphatase